MKVVCDACQAKYQIPDERVAGRKLKIRCRKCGGTILIRGDQDHAEQAGRDSQPASGVEWHVSLHGDQHGPYQGPQMADMLRGGQLSWDAYVWRESYSDWRMAGDSDTLVRAVAGAVGDTPVSSNEETPTRMMQSSPGLSAEARPARSSMASREAMRASQPPQVLAAASGAGLGTGPHASQAPRAYATSGAVASHAYAPQPSVYVTSRAAEPTLTGERNEDSVLFSARNLAATASIAPARGGYASGEGSGLIDIRALAALGRSKENTSQTGGAEERAPVRPSGDDLFRVANQTGAFSNLDSLAPMDRPSRAPNNSLAIAILGGSAMIAAAGVIAVYLLRSPGAPQPVAVAAPTAEVAVHAVPASDLVAANKHALEPSQANPSQPSPTAAGNANAAEPESHLSANEEATKAANRAAKAVISARMGRPLPAALAATSNVSSASSAKRGHAPEAAHAAKTAEPKPEISDATDKKSASPASLDDLMLDKPQKPSKSDEPIAAPSPAKAKEPARTRSIDDLLDDAVPSKEAAAAKKAAAAEAAGEALPEQPARDQVISAMRGVADAVQACAEGQELDSSTANVMITVAGSSGRVSSARVSGVVGAVGSCVANAVRNATFPKFARAQFTLNYPFKLKK